MQRLGAAVTRDINEHHRWDDPIFRGRFRNQVIHDPADLLTVASYIHVNPIRARLARRLDQHCWTSHRAYLGLDLQPPWLSTQTLLDWAGGQEAFAAFVQAYRSGESPWPEGFNADRGWFRRVKKELGAQQKAQQNASAPSVDEILARVIDHTGTTHLRLSNAGRGRIGNPARRFAVWALAKERDMQYAEIGRLLDMTPSQVAVTLARLKKDSSSPVVVRWMETWMGLQRSALI